MHFAVADRNSARSHRRKSPSLAGNAFASAVPRNCRGARKAAGDEEAFENWVKAAPSLPTQYLLVKLVEDRGCAGLISIATKTTL